ncbi:MAG: formylglycine-generating enzyme family protein, partial [Bacteroidota bacterium]
LGSTRGSVPYASIDRSPRLLVEVEQFEPVMIALEDFRWQPYPDNVVRREVQLKREPLDNFLDGRASKEFQEEGIITILDFYAYLQNIFSDPSRTDRERRQDSLRINDLFLENALIQVSSLTQGRLATYKLDEYLNSLFALTLDPLSKRYDKLGFEIDNLLIMSTLERTPIEKGEERRWKGTIRYDQSFKGYRNGTNRPVYEELTSKDVEVFVILEKDSVGENVFSTKLGNIVISSILPPAPQLNSIPLPNMIFIPGGTFQMGSDEGRDNERPIHEVTLSDFYLAETEVTFAQYDYFCEATGRMKPNDAGWGRDNRPVINVSWEDAQAYCQWVSDQTGLKYRLPTEAEWEYAAGGGVSNRTIYAGTNRTRKLDDFAWHRDNSNSTTHPVGLKKPNALGLYDMSGNVYEWCQDWYINYPSSAQTNPTGPFSGSYKVVRGGSWLSLGDLCRVAYRYDVPPLDDLSFVGFRVCRY